MDSWKLRDELLKAVSQWYLILGFILLGAIIGLALTYLMPAPYQAVTELYIGIDVERVLKLDYIIPLAEEEPLNLDDYKNWQLKQVADILKSDAVLNKTLDELHKNVPSLTDFTLQDIRKAIDIYWYDTGIWRLEVELPHKDQAVQVVDTWLETGHEKITELLQISKSGNAIDQEIWSLTLATSDLKKDRSRYQAISLGCSDWITTLEEVPADSQIQC